MQSNGKAWHVSLESAIHVIELISIFDTYNLCIIFDSEINISLRDGEYWKRCVLFLSVIFDSQHPNIYIYIYIYIYCGLRSCFPADEQKLWVIKCFQIFYVASFGFDWFGHWRLVWGTLVADPHNTPGIRVFPELCAMSEIYCAFKYNLQAIFFFRVDTDVIWWLAMSMMLLSFCLCGFGRYLSSKWIAPLYLRRSLIRSRT